MIMQTFCFLDGIGTLKESHLWESGITDWNSFVRADAIKGISLKRKLVHQSVLSRAKRALLADDVGFFVRRLPMIHHWRLFEYYRDNCLFIDVEFSSVQNGFITCLSIYDGYRVITAVKDMTWDERALKEIFSRCKMIITFNGSVCDIPLLRKLFPAMIPSSVLHWDLRYSAAHLGFAGGLKEVERLLGISRHNTIVDRLCGGDPYTLWRMFKGSGDRYYLNLFVEYNQEDVLNLETIAQKLYPMLKEKALDKDYQAK
ncbi:MAG: ribonuclease H-like domain-containing protein [Candidatus Woesearchaeota archaeon]